MNWRARLDSMRECPDSEPPKPTKGLLTVLAVGDPALSQQKPASETPPRPAFATTEQRAHLLALADDEGLPAGLVHGLDDADIAACAGTPDNTLRAYLRALDRGQRMDAGKVPLDWGEPAARTCEGCGPVLLWSTCPLVVKACPWCFRRKPIPRPRQPMEGQP